VSAKAKPVPAPVAPATPAKAIPPPLENHPHEGGCYVRNQDGSLTRVTDTEEQASG